MGIKITKDERKLLNNLFGTIALSNEHKMNLGTDLSVEYHDAGLKKLSNNELDTAAEDFKLSILVGYECLKKGCYFYPGVIASSCYYMSITFAKNADYSTALALAKESYHFYKDLIKTSGGYKKELSETKQLIMSLKDVIEIE